MTDTSNDVLPGGVDAEHVRSVWETEKTVAAVADACGVGWGTADRALEQLHLKRSSRNSSQSLESYLRNNVDPEDIGLSPRGERSGVADD